MRRSLARAGGEGKGRLSRDKGRHKACPYIRLFRPPWVAIHPVGATLVVALGLATLSRVLDASFPLSRGMGGRWERGTEGVRSGGGPGEAGSSNESR